jgi:hypothetical protein
MNLDYSIDEFNLSFTNIVGVVPTLDFIFNSNLDKFKNITIDLVMSNVRSEIIHHNIYEPYD